MANEKFKITESDQRRLIIDLLIRVTTENSIMREYVKIILGRDNPKVFEAMSKSFASEYTKRNLKLKETIYGDYGHIDLEDILPNLDDQD